MTFCSSTKRSHHSSLSNTKPKNAWSHTSPLCTLSWCGVKAEWKFFPSVMYKTYIVHSSVSFLNLTVAINGSDFLISLIIFHACFSLISSEMSSIWWWKLCFLNFSSYGTGVSNIITGIAGRITTQEQLDQVSMLLLSLFGSGNYMSNHHFSLFLMVLIQYVP